MGLDTTHGCWHGAYSAFARWREKLADVAGYTFHKTEDGRDQVDLDWGGIEATIGRNLFGEWPAIPVRPDGTPDPLIILLAHSDCEGRLQSDYLDALADRLEGLLPKLAGQDGGGHIGDYAAKTEIFIQGLREAARAGEDVRFH